jgi:hypothetical protein
MKGSGLCVRGVSGLRIGRGAGEWCLYKCSCVRVVFEAAVSTAVSTAKDNSKSRIQYHDQYRYIYT